MTSGFSQTKINLEIMTLDRDRIDIENRTLRMELEEAEGNVKSLSSSLDEKLSAIMVSEEVRMGLIRTKSTSCHRLRRGVRSTTSCTSLL